jgi:hypothetical protein
MPDGLSKVIRVRSPLVISTKGKVDPDILHQMLEAGLDAFRDDNDHVSLLKLLFGDVDITGLKVNTLGGPGMSTSVGIVDRFLALLGDAGIPSKKLLTWDRSDRELKSAGFELRAKGGPLCFGTDHAGVGFSADLASRGKVGGLLSKIQTNICQAVVNMPVLKDHGIAGITCSLKNNYGCIHNPNKYHDNGCDPYIADLNSLEQIRGKERLIVVDCLRVQFHGGPAYQPSYAANYGGILIGTDPVAIDTVGYGIIEELRKIAGKEPLRGSKREPIYLKRSAEYGLGIDDPRKIDLREITV